MRFVQRASAFVTWALLTTVGVLYVLEAVGIITDEWRAAVADALEHLSQPTIEQWAAALIGLGLAVLAVVVVIAQLTPYRRTVKYHLVVDEIADGQTVLSSGAIQTAINATIQTVDGVVNAKTVVGKRRHSEARISISDDTNALAAASTSGEKIDDEFWSQLGVPPYRVDLRFKYQRSAARVVQ